MGCDETRVRGDCARFDEDTEMDAVRKNAFIATPRGGGNEACPAVLQARPVKNPRSFEEMLEHAKKRFSKTLAYLAR